MSGRARRSVHDLASAVTGAGLVSALQPIVTLPERHVIGYEALARWPRTGVSPAEVFGFAASNSRSGELDSRCVDAGLAAALEANLPEGALLCLNVEPLSVYRPRRANAELDRVGDRLSIVFELTERDLLRDPSALLTTIAAIREDGFLIALDDVGAHPDSLTLLDVISPDFVKLDLELIQRRPRRDQARTLSAVMSYLERTGAVAIGEGIETDVHLEQARALGASLGQGYLFGHPQFADVVAQDDVTEAAITALEAVPPQPARLCRPFDVVTQNCDRRVRTARKEILTSLSHHLERQAADTVDPPMVLTVLQDRRHLTVHTRRRYEHLTMHSPLVAVFGCGLIDEPIPGVRGIALDAADPLCLEWTVITLGARTAAALIARELPAANSVSVDNDRLFEFVITHDRPLVIAAARTLLRRIDGSSAADRERVLLHGHRRRVE